MKKWSIFLTIFFFSIFVCALKYVNMIRISNISFFRFCWKNEKLDWPKCARTGNKQTKHREQKKGVSGYYRNQCWFAFVLWVLFTVFSFFLNASFGYINQKRMWPSARYWCTRLRISHRVALMNLLKLRSHRYLARS